MTATFIVTALIGVVIGIISGMLGVGGGMMMVPLFRLAYGMSAVVSTATSLFTIIPTSISGTISHLRAKTCVPKLGVALGVGGACTSPIGVWLAQIAPPWLVMIAAAAVIAYSSITMFKKALDMPRETPRRSGGNDSSGVTSDAQAAPEMPEFSRKQLIGASGIGLLAGLASGFVGLGGGFIMVPLMVAFLHMPMRVTSGTSLIAIMILATPATITQCALGNVDLLAGIAMACGTIPGAVLGARLMRLIPERTLRFVFGTFLLAAAVLLALKETGVLG